MDSISSILEANIDYQGQQTVKNISTALIFIGAAISLFTGFILNDIKYTCYVFAAFSLVTLLVSLPPFPQYRRHPLKWLPAKREEASNISIEL